MNGPLSVVIAYFLGSIPFGYLLVRWQRGIDIRTTGSGSIGATNVMRNLGLVGFVSTFLLDFAKGAGAVLLAARLTSADPHWIVTAAVASIAGHCFPVWLKFRGGKGIATAGGAFAVLAPTHVFVVLVIFALIVSIWRYVSLGSIISAAAFPVLLYTYDRSSPPIVIGAAVSAMMIIARHRSNIRRLLNGTERKVGRKKSADKSQ